MIVWFGEECGNENRRDDRMALRRATQLRIRSAALLRMCLILAIVEVVVPSTTPRRSVYGDQGQEGAWEVAWE